MIYFAIGTTGNIIQAQILPTLYKTVTAADGTTSQVVDTSNQPSWATNNFDDSVTDAVSALHDPAHWTYANSAWTYTAPTDAELLAQAQQTQIVVIEQGYAQTLNGGFSSSANGAALTYASDQVALTELGWVRGLTSTIYPTVGLEARLVDGTFVTLDYTQMQTLVTDSQTFFLAQRSQKVALVKQVQAATTVSTVQAVTWS